MQIGNSSTGYGIVHILLHWSIAALVLLTALVGFRMGNLPRMDPSTFETYNFHKSLGITVLGLVIARLLWRFVHGTPGLPAAMSPYERWAAAIVHRALYALMLLVPLLGWFDTSAAAIPVNWFRLVTLPQPIPADSRLQELLGTLHGLAAWTLLSLILLHALAALKHQFIDKDNVLRRMIVPERSNR